MKRNQRTRLILYQEISFHLTSHERLALFYETDTKLDQCRANYSEDFLFILMAMVVVP